MLPFYPESAELDLSQRSELEPILKEYNEGLSEFTFANLFLFRSKHNYRICILKENILLITGNDSGKPFFILPTRLPEKDILLALFAKYQCMKCVSETKQVLLRSLGFRVEEDRDNFDYLYFRSELANLPGKRFHKKRNLVQGFLNNYRCEGQPLLKENIPDAFAVLAKWHNTQGEPSDLSETAEALQLFTELKLCGAIYYIEKQPVGFVIGEPLVENLSYVIHFEKADTTYKGIYQFINKAFASILPKKYIYLNREQDLGDEGLRQAKLSYRPCGFIKKYRVFGP